ncbi:2-polyprenyl-6-methoxyphenol hydroxylase-like FAD-dependent oxidoreductase [Paenibacillus sp. DS2015]|uniref:FAD-dependent monooxygenase n=1 Tax=Paenibacillus sp. DS2015 TaxID=3373917 RepID=UPI003D2437A1
MLDKTFLIVGGGIAGLTAAVALQQCGINVHVYERFLEFRDVGSGLTLAPNAMKALEYIGLSQIVKEQSKTSPSGFAILNEQGTVLSELSANGQGSSIVSIHRADLHRILLSALRPETLIFGKSLVDLRQSEEAVTAIFADGSEVTGDYLLSADGIHSIIRNKLFPSVELRYAGYSCWRGVADCWPDSGRDDRFTETWGYKGRFGIVPLPNKQTYWFAVLNGTPRDRKFNEYQIQDLLDIFGDYHSPVSQILSSTPDDKISYKDIYDIAPIKKFIAGRTLLIGDAAHASTPNLGQGACQAIEDAIEIVRCLKQNSSIKSAFRAFELLRGKRTAAITNQSLMMGKIAQMDQRMLCYLRNMMMRLTPHSVQRNAMRFLYDVDFSD